MDKLVNKLQTGDLVYFTGHKLYNYMINFLIKSDWTHVGMILRKGKKIYISESHISIDGVKVSRNGINLIEIGERLRGTKTPVMFVRLKNRITDKQEAAAWKRYEELKKANFSLTFVTDMVFKTKDSMSKMFCSEYVAEMYKAMGLIRKDILTNKFNPKTFMLFDSKYNGLEFDYQKPYEFFSKPREDFANISTHIYFNQPEKSTIEKLLNL